MQQGTQDSGPSLYSDQLYQYVTMLLEDGNTQYNVNTFEQNQDIAVVSLEDLARYLKILVTSDISEVGLVIYNKNHYTALHVKKEGGKINAHFYDPLSTSTQHEYVKEVQNIFTNLKCENVEVTQIPASKNNNGHQTQPQYNNCGIFAVNFLHNKMKTKNNIMTEDFANTIRDNIFGETHFKKHTGYESKLEAINIHRGMATTFDLSDLREYKRDREKIDLYYELTANNTKLAIANAGLKADNTGLDGLFKALKEKNADLNAANEALKVDNAELNKKNQYIKVKNADLNKLYTDLNIEYSANCLSLKQVNELTLELNDQIELLKADIPQKIPSFNTNYKQNIEKKNLLYKEVEKKNLLCKVEVLEGQINEQKLLYKKQNTENEKKYAEQERIKNEAVERASQGCVFFGMRLW